MIVINLIELRGEILQRIDFLMPSCQTTEKEFLHAVDRAIAAESERDELKSNLAEIEAQLPVAYTYADSLKNLERTGNALMYQEQQEFKLTTPQKEYALYLHAKPPQPIANNSDKFCDNNCTWRDHHVDCERHEADQVSESVQRITEQDAREIATQFFYWWHNQPGKNTMQGFGEWITDEGRTLLAKLNEHREPEVKPKESIDPKYPLATLRYILNLKQDSSRNLSDTVTEIINKYASYPPVESSDLIIAKAALAKLAELDVAMLINSQVTPNKAESPSHIEAEPIGFVDANGDAILSRRVKGGYLYWGDAQPLPPLKGDDK